MLKRILYLEIVFKALLTIFWQQLSLLSLVFYTPPSFIKIIDLDETDKPFSITILTILLHLHSLNLSLSLCIYNIYIQHSSLESTSIHIISFDSHNPSKVGRANTSVFKLKEYFEKLTVLPSLTWLITRVELRFLYSKPSTLNCNLIWRSISCVSCRHNLR